jgi:hypothetical protein
MSIEQKREGMKQAMPQTAAWVAELRQALGAEGIDQAIKAGQQAKRQHQALCESQGQAAADAWLRRQRFASGCFFAAENGHTVGIKRP